MGVVDGGFGDLPGGWNPVGFTVDELMTCTFLESLYARGWRIGLSCVLMERR